MPSDSAGYHDDRPRVHIWPEQLGLRFRWSIGPTGRRSQDYLSLGLTVDAAFAHLGGTRRAVIIVEPMG